MTEERCRAAGKHRGGERRRMREGGEIDGGVSGAAGHIAGRCCGG